MPAYITLGNFTDQGARAIKDSPDRFEAFKALAEGAGVTIKSVHWTTGAYDMVLMMDCSQCPIHPKLQQAFHDTAKNHAAAVRQAGAEPVLFLSWAYQDKPEMMQQLADEYLKVGRANGMRVVPAGPAFAASTAQRPDINLWAPDKRHPSLAGTYLGAAVVMASLFKKSPVGNSYTAGLPADVALHLQTVAWDTVQSSKP